MKKILAILLAAMMVFSLVPNFALAAYTQERIDRLSPPTLNAFSDKRQTWVTVIHSEDAMRHIAADDSGHWADAEGGDTGDDYWWNGYGKGYRYDNYVQIDWRVSGGQWHYTSEWDTNLSACEEFIADSAYFWGSDCGANYHVLNNENCYKAEADSPFYPVKNYFREYFDGYDYYYLFDQSKTVEFRCRYLIKETSGGYYNNDETEESVRYISSDWSAVETYGAAGNSQAQMPGTLSAPTLESPEVSVGTGYANANEIYFYAFTPADMAYLSTLGLDIGEISVSNRSTYLVIEASLDGQNWRQFKKDSLSNQYTLDTSDVWYHLLREDESLSWGDYVWYTSDVYIRARYELDYQLHDYTTDQGGTIYVDDVFSPYSNVLQVNVPGVNLYNININYKTDGASDYSKKSFVCNEHSTIGWINTRPLEGFYVTKVLVNGTVMYDKENERTYELLDWYSAQEFRFWNDPMATEDLEIDIYFGGQSPTKHTLSYTRSPASTGDGSIDVSYPGGNYTFAGATDSVRINQGVSAALNVKASKGCVISQVVIDGQNQSVTSGAQTAEFTLSNLQADHTVEVTYDRTAHYCYAGKSGDGSVSVIAPENYEEADWYVATGETFTVQAVADEGQRILCIRINGQNQDLSAYGDAANLTEAIVSVPGITQEVNVTVDFSSPDTEYVTLTIQWNEGGECNDGQTTQQVVKGSSYSIYIQPQTGYKVATITDGDRVIDNFVGDHYYVQNINTDRTIVVEFSNEGLPMAYGDVNQDGSITAADALIVLQISVKLREANETQTLLGDVNVDGKLDATDALNILQKSVKLIDHFKADEVNPLS